MPPGKALNTTTCAVGLLVLVALVGGVLGSSAFFSVRFLASLHTL